SRDRCRAVHRTAVRPARGPSCPPELPVDRGLSPPAPTRSSGGGPHGYRPVSRPALLGLRGPGAGDGDADRRASTDGSPSASGVSPEEGPGDPPIGRSPPAPAAPPPRRFRGLRPRPPARGERSLPRRRRGPPAAALLAHPRPPRGGGHPARDGVPGTSGTPTHSPLPVDRRAAARGGRKDPRAQPPALPDFEAGGRSQRGLGGGGGGSSRALVADRRLRGPPRSPLPRILPHRRRPRAGRAAPAGGDRSGLLRGADAGCAAAGPARPPRARARRVGLAAGGADARLSGHERAQPRADLLGQRDGVVRGM